MTNRIAGPLVLFVVIVLRLVWATPCLAAEKNVRLIGLYDVMVMFKDPPVNWQRVSDAFVKQFLLDTEKNECIEPSLLPQHFLGNPEPKTFQGADEGISFDYLAYADLYKDVDGYHVETYLVRGADREVVRKGVSAQFTDLKQAPWEAQMAALDLRMVGSGTHPLAELIRDFVKKTTRGLSWDGRHCPGTQGATGGV